MNNIISLDDYRKAKDMAINIDSIVVSHTDHDDLCIENQHVISDIFNHQHCCPDCGKLFISLTQDDFNRFKDTCVDDLDIGCEGDGMYHVVIVNLCHECGTEIIPGDREGFGDHPENGCRFSGLFRLE